MLWRADSPIVLASKSAVRRSMLEAAGLPVEVRAADIDERAIEQAAAGAQPDEVARLLAVAKAQAVATLAPGRVVVAADQTLACEGRVFHKARDRTAARDQIAALRGREHALHSAVAVAVRGAIAFKHVETARLSMRSFSDDFLEGYLDTVGTAACQSVGGYQLEGPGIQLFARIDGDYFTILGLPLLPLLAYLREAGLLSA